MSYPEFSYPGQPYEYDAPVTLRRRRESVTVVELLEWMRTRKEPWTITPRVMERALSQFLEQ